MRVKSIFISLVSLLLLASSAYGQTEKTFKLNQTDLAPETRKNIITAFEPGYSKKVGGDLFTAKFGADKFRYDYEGEWIEFEPLNHRPMLSSSLSNRLKFSNYWTDTVLKFTIRDYGVKVDIILMSSAAPKEFEFRVSKSARWEDRWIQPVYAYTLDKGMVVPVGMSQTEALGMLTYTITETPFGYPVIIDPTFELGVSVDDTYAQTDAVSDNDYNQFTETQMHMGQWFSQRYIDNAYWRWITENVPRASKIMSANISFKASFNDANPTFTVYGLEKDNKWETSNGFNLTSYADDVALNAIPRSAASEIWSPTAWTAENWYDTNNIMSLLQEAVDDLAGYDPLHAEDKYVGLVIVWESGADGLRWSYQVDDSLSRASELDVTFEPWGEIMVCGGYKVTDGELSYYGY